MKIYTKTGDKGYTSLYDGSRVEKGNKIFGVLGNIDLLSSAVGEICAEMNSYFLSFLDIYYSVRFRDYKTFSSIREDLRRIQSRFIHVGSMFATPSNKHFSKLKFIDDQEITELENDIDLFAKFVPPLKTFILPGSTVLNSKIHTARAVCRIVERKIQFMNSCETESVILNKDKFDIVFKYINRLSDYFFQLSRYTAYMTLSKDELTRI